MAVVYGVIGLVLVLAVTQDVFTTVLFPASGRGLLRKPLTIGVDVERLHQLVP